MPTLVNHYLAVRHPADAERLVAELTPMLPADMRLERLDGERGALGIPRWTTFVFSMSDVHHADVVHLTDRLLTSAGVRDAFAAPELG